MTDAELADRQAARLEAARLRVRRTYRPVNVVTVDKIYRNVIVTESAAVATIVSLPTRDELRTLEEPTFVREQGGGATIESVTGETWAMSGKTVSGCACKQRGIATEVVDV
jgi:hypothetical protein